MNKTDIADMYKNACAAYEKEHARANDLQRKARAAAKAASDAKRTIDMIETLDPSIKRMTDDVKSVNDAHVPTHVTAPSVPTVPRVNEGTRSNMDPAHDPQLQAILHA